MQFQNDTGYASPLTIVLMALHRILRFYGVDE